MAHDQFNLCEKLSLTERNVCDECTGEGVGAIITSQCEVLEIEELPNC